MPLVYRLDVLMQCTTQGRLSETISRTAGWSESHWSNVPISHDDPSVREIYQKRSLLLPVNSGIVGGRISTLNLDGGTLTHRGSVAASVNYPGSSVISGLPQKALTVVRKSNAVPNVSRSALRCIPDDNIVGGEFFAGVTFASRLTSYMNIQRGWHFLARDLSAANVNFLGFLEGNPGQFQLWVDATLGAVEPGFYIQLRRASVLGVNVSGSYRALSDQAGPNGVGRVYVIQGEAPVLETAAAVGLARRDLASMVEITAWEIGRATVRKVGRPFAAFRGRASARSRT